MDSELKRRKPIERPHREVVGAAVMDSELFCEIIQREEGMTGVKAFLIFPVAAFHFAVMTGCIGAYQLMADSRLCGCLLK